MLSDRPARILLLFGGLAAIGLSIVAFSDFGDPIEAARSEAQARARNRADSLHAAWQRLLLHPADPVQANVAVNIGPPTLFGTEPDSSTAQAPRPFDVLLDSALAISAAGHAEQARQLVKDAVRRFPDDERTGEARLHLARWASALGDEDDVNQQRQAIESDVTAAGFLDGTSIALIVSLVHPVAPATAFAILSSDEACLPEPSDRVVIHPDGSSSIVWDPWWSEFRNRLSAADNTLDWSQAFRLEARKGQAVRRFLGGEISTEEGLWTLRRRAGGLFAARQTSQGTRVLHIQEAQVAKRLRSELALETQDPHSIRFDHEAPNSEPLVHSRDWLSGTSIGFTVHRADPLRAGRAERLRLQLVRWGLIVLALAILGATVLAARSMQRSRRLTRLRSTLVASVSHDLRTPIQSILLMAETLERGKVATDRSRGRYFKTMRQEAQRLGRFVEDLLDSARIDRGDGARIERRTVQMAPFLTELESAMRERASRDGAALTLTHTSLPESLVLDPDGLHRAIWNLFENALRYGHQANEKPQVEVHMTCEEGVLSVTIHDQGPGIPARYAKSVFEPFERVRDSNQDPSLHSDSGTGLGLSIVRAIAQAHGGDVQLMPSAKGARFLATFSVTENENPDEGAA